MSNLTAPPYLNIDGLFIQVDKHVEDTLANYNGNARPGQLVVDPATYTLYVGNANGDLNAVGGGGGGTPGGLSGQVQYNQGGAFAGSSNFTFNGTNLNVTGNITGTYLLGNGAFLTGITSGTNYSNANVANYLPVYSGNVGNGAGYIFGNGAFLTGIAAGNGNSNYSNANVASYLPTYTGNLNGGNLTIATQVTLPGINQYNTTSANANLLMLVGNGQVGYDSTIFYDNIDSELHVGNIVLNDNITGGTIGIDENNGDLQFVVNKNGADKAEVMRLIGSKALLKLFPQSGTPPAVSLGAFYFNNDGAQLSGVGLYFCADGSTWQKVNLT